jgi:anthranilate phosphoribosyltransferase
MAEAPPAVVRQGAPAAPAPHIPAPQSTPRAAGAVAGATDLPRPAERTEFPAILDRLLDRVALGEAEARALMDDILQGGLGPERLAAFVTAMRAKGIAVDELVGFARSLRAHAEPLEAGPGPFLDTCGTGGARHKSFNVSTAAAFVAAAAGVRVAKHGNRSVTRPSGSADVLEAAGARLDLPAPAVGRILREQGIAFLFAPRFHPAMRHAAPVRKALGIRTVFNLLGPLANPAHATQHVLGVHDPALLAPMAEALARLGVRSGHVLHGDPGYDEAMPTGLVRFVQLRDGEAGGIRTLDPASLGLIPAKPEALAPVPPAQAAQVLRAILEGRETGARSDAVAFNAAFALVAAGRARTLADGLDQARSILREGTARTKLDSFVAATQAQG